MPKRLSSQEIKLRLSKLPKNIKLLEPYESFNTFPKGKCTRCKNVWNVNVGHITSGKYNSDCPNCSRISAGFSKRSTIEQEQVKLDKKLGNSLNKVLEILDKQVCRILCSEGHIWKSRISDLCEGTNGCRTCHKYNSKYTEKYIKNKLLDLYGFSVRLKTKFKGSLGKNKTLEFICDKKHCFKYPVTKLLYSYTGCPFCKERELLYTEDKKIEERGLLKGWELLTYRTKRNQVHTFKCIECGYLKQSRYGYFEYGCAICAYERSIQEGHLRKEVTLGKRTVKLQGYEHLALIILRQEGIRANYIKTTVAEGKPTIRYNYLRKVRNYLPDFYISSINCIVEVKSTYTLGLTKYSKRWFTQNKRKAKACLKQGFNFRLMLMDQTGSELVLPENWYDLSRRKVIRYVRSYNLYSTKSLS